jgi:hypothetical protein
MGLAAAPLLLMVCLVTALRIASAAPAEFPARWVFAVAPAPAMAGRDALRHVMIGLAVLPLVCVSGAIWWAQFGPALAVGHALVTLLAGLILVEIQSWGVVHVPCTRPLDPGTVNLQARWPAYVLGLLLFCVELPQAEVMLARSRFASPFLLVLLAALLVVIRRGSASAARVSLAYGDNDLLLLLDLSTPPPRRDDRPIADAGRQDEHRNPRSS